MYTLTDICTDLYYWIVRTNFVRVCWVDTTTTEWAKRKKKTNMIEYYNNGLPVEKEHPNTCVEDGATVALK